jgi:hypothetical protein
MPQSLRENYTPKMWGKFQVDMAGKFLASRKNGRVPNRFEIWLLKHSRAVRERGLVAGANPTGVNWAMVMAGAAIPLALPATIPIAAIIVASLASGAAGKIIGDNAERAIRQTIKNARANASSFNADFVTSAAASSEIDDVVRGLLWGVGGMASAVAESSGAFLVHVARDAPGMEYKVSVMPKYLRRDAALYFAELGSEKIVERFYEAKRHDIERRFRDIVDRGYDESVAGQAILATWWLSLNKAIFESPPDTLVSMSAPDVRSAHPTLDNLKGCAVDWDLQRANMLPKLIVWLAFDERNSNETGVRLQNLGAKASASEARNQLNDFRRLIEATWRGRSQFSPAFYSRYPD